MQYTEVTSIQECHAKRHSCFYDKKNDILYIHTAGFNEKTRKFTELSRGVMQFNNWSETQKHI